MDKLGRIVSGKLANKFEGQNTKASFIIPSETEFSYDVNNDDYMFKLDDSIGSVKTTDIEYNINWFLRINKDHSFVANVKDFVSFKKNNQSIIFIRNDSPVWINNEQFDYNFYSKRYRDKIEYDILAQKNLITIQDLEIQFEPHVGPGMQQYRGTTFYLTINTKQTKISLEKIIDTNDIIRCFNVMKVGRPYISSYEYKLIIPLSINQFGEYKEGKIELIVPVDEVNNIEKIIKEERNLYLLFRMGIFSDFNLFGYGITYFSYDDLQVETLFNDFK